MILILIFTKVTSDHKPAAPHLLLLTAQAGVAVFGTHFAAALDGLMLARLTRLVFECNYLVRRRVLGGAL